MGEWKGKNEVTGYDKGGSGKRVWGEKAEEVNKVWSKRKGKIFIGRILLTVKLYHAVKTNYLKFFCAVTHQYISVRVI